MKKKCEWKIFPIASRFHRPKTCKNPVKFKCFPSNGYANYACESHGLKWHDQNPDAKMEPL